MAPIEDDLFVMLDMLDMLSIVEVGGVRASGAVFICLPI